MENNDKIEQMKENLYSRTSSPASLHKGELKPEGDSRVLRDWQHPDDSKDDLRLNDTYRQQGSSFFKKMLIASVIFFVFALILGVYVLLRGENVVSANNVDITVAAPASIAGGEVLSMDIKVHNNNAVRLEVVDLSVEFPAGTADPEDTSKELRRFRKTLPDIVPDGTQNLVVKSVLYGEENTKKEIKIKVEYRVKNSNAIFFKEKTYEIFLNTSPISLNITAFNEVVSGQDVEITAVLVSNSKEVLKNVLLKAEYPFGFSFASANPQPSYDNNTWRLGDIEPGTKRTIKIKGKIEGQDEEERVFRFMTGSQSTRNVKVIGTQYISTVETIRISKPFLGVDVEVGGREDNYIVELNRTARVKLAWANNLPTAVSNAEIQVKLGGNAYSKEDVNVQNGYFRSADNTIIWNRTTMAGFANIPAGAAGELTFSLTPRLASQIVNPQITLDVSVRGTRLSDENVPEQVSSAVRKIIKIPTEASISAQIVRSIGPFTNTGPIPPVVDNTTTYTVVWTVGNTSSTIENTTVKASLPPYVHWMGKISPTGEDITYNTESGEVTWKIGSVRPYTGGDKKRQVAFQIGFEPSQDQVGSYPYLVGDSILSATDQFTGESLKAMQQALTTRFGTDPQYKSGDEVVKKQ
jgi:hypothetical protein